MNFERFNLTISSVVLNNMKENFSLENVPQSDILSRHPSTYLA